VVSRALEGARRPPGETGPGAAEGGRRRRRRTARQAPGTALHALVGARRGLNSEPYHRTLTCRNRAL